MVETIFICYLLIPAILFVLHTKYSIFPLIAWLINLLVMWMCAYQFLGVSSCSIVWLGSSLLYFELALRRSKLNLLQGMSYAAVGLMYLVY